MEAHQNGENTWNNIKKGIIAGFVATIVLSILMIMKQMMGFMPEMNPIQMITQMMGTQSMAIGWVIHFFIGTIMWGILFALVDPFLPGYHWFRGVIFATGAWLIMMVVMMPMAGAGFFAMNMGMMGAMGPLMGHWIFGIVLGGVYGAIK